MITLYDCATAPSPRRARILLAEKGIAHETVQVDLRTSEQLGEAYRRINPRCTVPALRTDDGLLLTDNAAIAAWVEARFPQPPLLGVTPAEKAQMLSASISIAMNNTAFALMVAIPFLLVHSFLQAKTSEIVDGLEAAKMSFLNLVQRLKLEHAATKG